MSKSRIKKAYSLLGQEYYDARKNKSGISYLYNELYEFPTTLKMLGNVRGKKILDLGCGPGIHSEKLRKMGAIVKGIDISSNLIKIAKSEAPKVEFKVGDIEREKLPYRDSEFDIVFSSLVLGHLKRWDFSLSEIHRVLKKGGIFVFSGYNPVTEKFSKKKWFFKKFKVMEDYFAEGERVTKWAKDKEKTAEIVHYHKTYGTIVRLLVSNGFEIIDYEDCKPLKCAKEFDLRHYDHLVNSPHFCVWKVKK